MTPIRVECSDCGAVYKSTADEAMDMEVYQLEFCQFCASDNIDTYEEDEA